MIIFGLRIAKQTTIEREKAAIGNLRNKEMEQLLRKALVLDRIMADANKWPRLKLEIKNMLHRA